jgi:hypothetical protein
VRRGFSPLDQRLGLVRHSWSPQTVQQALRLAVEIPSYRRAAASFEALTQVALSRGSLATLVREYGGALVAQQAAEAEQAALAFAGEHEPGAAGEPEAEAERMAVSFDGVMIHLRDEGWKETKIVTVSQVEVETGSEGEEPQVQLTHHSYRAGVWEAEAFAKQQGAEGYRRGLAKTKQVITVGDGAAWIWGIIQTWYAPCVQIIDWWHALQYVWAIANSVCGRGTEAARAWCHQLQEPLWAGEMGGLLRAVRLKWPRGKTLPDDLRQALRYLWRYRERMHYATFREQGYPIGSGSVESACKVVVQQRLVQAGMRWGRENAQALLALRCALLSDRWETTWRSLAPAKVT